MKQITNKTKLIQGDKTYSAVEVDGVIYWFRQIKETDKGYFYDIMMKSIVTHNNVYSDYIIAQSEPKLEGIPVISLDGYFVKLEEIGQRIIDIFRLMYTQKDIEKAIELAQMVKAYGDYKPFTKDYILEQINSISVIEVDEQMQILNYE